MRDGVGIEGFSFDLFQNVARQLGRSSEVKELPWARCLSEVKAGRVDVAIDAYEDADRHKTFHYSTPYYTLTPQIFYVGATAGNALPVTTAQGLKKLNGCGLHEYTYEHYDLDADKLDLGATTDLQMLQKLKIGRCSYALEELEYVIGGRNFNPAWLDETGILSFRPSWARGPQVHFLVGNGRPDGAQLIEQLNAAIGKSSKSGFIKALQRRYFQTSIKPGVK
jgi:ABC-type amino acid transport substrate-binding protein